MDELTSLRAELVAYRFSLQLLWANVIRQTADPLETCRRLANDSAATIEAMCEAAAGSHQHVVGQMLIGHHESLWRGIEQQIQTQLDEHHP